MFGVAIPLALAILIGLGLAVLAVVLWVVLAVRRYRRRQDRLSRGFERAQKASKTGSGIQGKPYSVYGEPSWTDKINNGR
jgi:hypothetical protein